MSNKGIENDSERRTKIFGLIENLVKEWEEQGEDPDEAFAEFVSERSSKNPLLPRIMVRDEFVVCNHCSIDLSRRPMTLRLFRAFCTAPRFERSREDLLRQVYKLKNLDDCTDRYLEAMYNNAVKLISRARILATMRLSYAVGHGIEWFVYDQERKIWCLFRMRNEYLSSRLGMSTLPYHSLN